MLTRKKGVLNENSEAEILGRVWAGHSLYAQAH